MTAQTEPELLPCPFCGGQAAFERLGDYRQSCVIECESCGCRLETGEEGSLCGSRWNDRAVIAADRAKRVAGPVLTDCEIMSLYNDGDLYSTLAFARGVESAVLVKLQGQP